MATIARSFRDLNAYRLARGSAGKVFQMTKLFPADERYSLTDQIRRSSRAVSTMVASAWARRRYRAAFISKLDEALEEAAETQAWLDHAADSLYISSEHFQSLDSAWESVGALINGMINRAEDFCKLPAHADHRIALNRNRSEQR